ncbi:unnamed protein product [Rhizoctonia solani]|uniref:F-box domain-containing protein n=1 Tax=Rhizoctonia solani TaxID=456999 RepID=A0A8H3B4X9_9AGAM|nr:unnamed protein product [Rhizoctonia solani]
MDRETFALDGISPELIIQILHYCEYPSILSFAATCKAYHELVVQSTSLQLHIELEVQGLEIVNQTCQRGTSYAVLLNDLRRFRDGWLDLEFAAPVDRLVGDSGMLLWELREGFYIRAFSRFEERFSDALQLIPLDSTIPVPLPLTFEFTFNEFTADPRQELLAMLSRDTKRDAHVHIYLCSSTTGLAHPSARHPRLTAEFDFETPYFWPGFSIEIMGRLVVAKVLHPQAHIYELLIWDWRAGILLDRISSQRGICDFTFLDQQHLVVFSGSQSKQEHLDTLALLVYVISKETPTCTGPPNNGPLRVADFPISQPILRLEFPRIRESLRISETGFFLRSEPTPGRAMHTTSVTFACAYAITLSMTFFFRDTFDGWGGYPYYRVFLDGKFLLDQVRTCLNSGMRVLPWSSWGANVTRWFVEPEGPDHWICWMSGSRFITSLPNRPYFCIFDFSPPAVRRYRDRFAQAHPVALDHLVDHSDLAMADGFEDLDRLAGDINLFSQKSPPGHELFAVTVGADNPCIIKADEYPGFEESITSQLPYRLVFRTNNRKNHEGWQINGDCVVGISSQEVSETLTVYKLK